MKHLFLLVLAPLAVAFLFLPSCRKSLGPSGPDTAGNIVLTPGDSTVMLAENQFAFDMFRQVGLQDTTLQNKMISPLSLYMALGMAEQGAAGTTRDSIEGALRLPYAAVANLGATANAMLTQMPPEDPRVTMSIANAVWFNQDVSLLPGYVQAVQSDYQASSQGLDFGSPGAAQVINQWVASRTRNMIPGIIQETDKSDSAILVNAMFFQGAWTYAFDASLTKDEPFTRADGSQVNVPTMVPGNAARFRCTFNDSVNMIELPYGAGNFDMYALIPVGAMDIRGLAKMLNAGLFARWQSRLDSARVELYFPRFGFDYSLENMKPELQGMGMGLAFTPGADFSNMFTGKNWISQVIHKTAIRVSEAGTRAAAATVVVIGITAVQDPVALRFDHPFLFVITERSSGAILFVGLLADPSNAGS